MTKPGNGFARRVTKANLQEFKVLLRQKSDLSADDDANQVIPDNGNNTHAPSPELAHAESLFLGTPISIKNIFSPKTSNTITGNGTNGNAVPVVATVAPVVLPAAPSKGVLRWEKKLSKTDAQRQTGNVTGDLRLTQANFKVAGSVIDQTTYFRHTVFPTGTWTIERPYPRVDICTIDFMITILGKNYGLYQLIVSHKPSGEAGQGNYTTGIRWGNLRHILESVVNVTGKDFHLYAPPGGKSSPFFIEIT